MRGHRERRGHASTSLDGLRCEDGAASRRRLATERAADGTTRAAQGAARLPTVRNAFAACPGVRVARPCDATARPRLRACVRSLGGAGSAARSGVRRRAGLWCDALFVLHARSQADAYGHARALAPRRVQATQCGGERVSIGCGLRCAGCKERRRRQHGTQQRARAPARSPTLGSRRGPWCKAPSPGLAAAVALCVGLRRHVAMLATRCDMTTHRDTRRDHVTQDASSAREASPLLRAVRSTDSGRRPASAVSDRLRSQLHPRGCGLVTCTVSRVVSRENPKAAAPLSPPRLRRSDGPASPRGRCRAPCDLASTSFTSRRRAREGRCGSTAPLESAPDLEPPRIVRAAWRLDGAIRSVSLTHRSRADTSPSRCVPAIRARPPRLRCHRGKHRRSLALYARTGAR